MRIIVIVPDNVVFIDGEGYTVDCSSLSNTHAIQWYGDRGEIERTTFDPQLGPDRHFTDITQFQFLIDAWNAAKLSAQAAEAVKAAAMAQAATAAKAAATAKSKQATADYVQAKASGDAAAELKALADFVSVQALLK